MVLFRSVLTLLAIAASQAACLGAQASASSAPGGAQPASAQPGALDPLGAQGVATTHDPHRTIVAGDLLEVAVFDAPELSRTTRVSDAGDISLPLIGVVLVAGKTARDIEVAVRDKLRGRYMLDPHVSVEVKEAVAQPIYVLGEVNQPGAFTPAGNARLTILQAVAVARGLKPTASRRRAVVIRASPEGDRQQIHVNLNDVVKGKVPDMVLEPSDVVYVQKNSERAVALGVVDAMLRAVTFRAVF
jgi:polysaccharide export outer membrane protein